MANSRITQASFALPAVLPALVIILGLALTPSASAGVAYTPPKTISEDGSRASNPQIAIDSSGRATVVWASLDGSGGRIQAVRLAADGTPGPVGTLSGVGLRAVRDPQVAIDSSDRATVVWSTARRIQAVRLAADGTPGPVQALSEAPRRAHEPQLAIDGSDRATVVWWRNDGVQAVRLSAEGTPGPVQTLMPVSAYDPQVAIDGSDRATVVWQTSVPYTSQARIDAVRLGADGTPGPVQILSRTDQDDYYPQVAIDGSGRATVSWLTTTDFDSIRAVGIAPDGTPSAIQTLSGFEREASGAPQVAASRSGGATIVWTQADSGHRLQVVRLAADGSPGPVQTLSKAGENADYPEVAIDSSDRATIVWARCPSTMGCDETSPRHPPRPAVQSVRLKIDGTPGPTQTLSEPGASNPQIALEGSDRATVVWSGRGRRIQVVRSLNDTKLKGSAAAKRTQRQHGKGILVEVKIKAQEMLTAEVDGEVKLGKKPYKLARETKRVGPGEEKAMKLEPTKPKAAEKIAAALKEGKAASAKVQVKLADEAGNTESEKLKVRLLR